MIYEEVYKNVAVHQEHMYYTVPRVHVFSTTCIYWSIYIEILLPGLFQLPVLKIHSKDLECHLACLVDY